MYKVVKAHNVVELESKVQSLIAEGYVALGGIAVADENGVQNPDGTNALTYCQAMVKKPEAEENEKPGAAKEPKGKKKAE